MYKFREPTDRELKAKIKRLEQILRAYRVDVSTKEWIENEIDRFRGIITERENKKEQAKAGRKKKATRHAV